MRLVHPEFIYLPLIIKSVLLKSSNIYSYLKGTADGDVTAVINVVCSGIAQKEAAEVRYVEFSANMKICLTTLKP